MGQIDFKFLDELGIMLNRFRVNELIVWILSLLVYVSGSSIVMYLFPSLPRILLFVYFIEVILVAIMIISINRMNQALSQPKKYSSTYDIVDIEA
jgi:hypothetical protein